MKEEAVLKYIGNQLGQPRQRNIADVHTPNADTPLLRLIETQDQLLWDNDLYNKTGLDRYTQQHQVNKNLIDTVKKDKALSVLSFSFLGKLFS